ncbi:conserved exported hypothetical protein [Frankia sp. AiPs1]|uniref:hypothetical protein n=1 Tax=Frankia sp. AiPa1 TaxID=573492 RepID=UPI00202B9896|nr:hypothetical protein [Frankia sp. AiPa1]MCL9758043.1 hypothetical protein [Frankia sp. AiPa1]
MAHMRWKPAKAPRAVLALVAVLTLVVLAASAGCARRSNGTIDAPLGQQDDSRAQIINAPDGWRNIMTKCVPFQAGKRLYEARGEQGEPVIVDDPACKG